MWGKPPCLVVFSHPNHELAVFGFVQRYRPHLLFVTDGSSARRVAETRAALESVGLAAQARFLGHAEGAVYEALVRRDVPFCRRLVEEIAAAGSALQPQSVFCDSIEFYNPVHDLTLPLTLAAFPAGDRRPALFEVPLIYQRPGPGTQYEIQRLPPSQQATQIELQLSDAELVAKLWARDHVYGELRAQLGGLLDLPATHTATEVLRPFSGLPQPDDERVLRYEWRGRLRQERGEVEQVITYAAHYQPLTAALTAL